jgi:hypothetical protein
MIRANRAAPWRLSGLAGSPDKVIRIGVSDHLIGVLAGVLRGLVMPRRAQS